MEDNNKAPNPELGVDLPNDPNQFSLTKERLIELGFEEINGLLWYEWFPFGLAYIDDEDSPVIGDDYLEPYWGVWCANCLLGLRLRNEAHLRDLFIAHRVVPPRCANWKATQQQGLTTLVNGIYKDAQQELQQQGWVSLESVETHLLGRIKMFKDADPVAFFDVIKELYNVITHLKTLKQ